MRLLDTANGLDDFPESSQLIAIATNGHRRDLQPVGQSFVRGGALPVEYVEDKSRSIFDTSGGSHDSLASVI
jgi:hypothetical protein